MLSKSDGTCTSVARWMRLAPESPDEKPLRPEFPEDVVKPRASLADVY